VSESSSAAPKQPYWVVYIALLLAGILLLADAYDMPQLSRWTAR